ncbi:unnamed protein product, partial [marine sediment metagenome]
MLEQLCAYRFELSDVFADAEVKPLQMQNGIKDQLARIVCRGAAASADINYVDLLLCQIFSAGQQFVGALP